MKIAIMLMHYNIPEATQELYGQVDKRVKDLKDIIVIDNGSKPEWKYPNADLYLPKNEDITGGVLRGLEFLLEKRYDYAWVLSASARLDDRFTEYDPLERLVDAYEDFSARGTVGIIQPSFYGNIRGFTHKDIGTNWSDAAVIHTRAGLFSFYHIETCMKYINQDLPSSWGIDDEMPYLMEKDGLLVLLHHGVRFKITEGMSNKSGRYKKDNIGAIRQMKKVFTEKYGENWIDIIVAPHCRENMKRMVGIK